ncbi:zinc finger protein ZAT12-like [Pyrus communis]|uniref:zinc finger protein ZAT12-like n=1 Tax=Pyrus communis TaxID=23211 RepID=UPI0035BF590C
MKRSGQDETLDMVNCLMLLSKVGEPDSSPIKYENSKKDRVFVCKTCDREFPSFQALGGHRASHKKPKLMPGGAVDPLHLAEFPVLPVKPKKHECPICGLEFTVGQALGGHMRRHRDVIQAAAARAQPSPPMPVLKKSNSSKRVSCLNLELNLDLHLAPPGHHQYDLTKLQMIS